MVARLALRSASRIVSTAALRTASIGASRTASRIVVKSWGPRAGGRVEPSRARSLGRVRSGAEPSQESRCWRPGPGPGPGGFVLEIG